MKLLHTSDLHLGQYFMGKSRQSEHTQFIKWLAKQAKEHKADALLIAGDVFDTGAPPSYARELYNQLIVELKAVNTQLVILAGNHDSVSVLEESKALLSHMNAQVVSTSPSNLQDAVLTLNNQQGQPAALLCAIPYLRAKELVISQAGQSAKQKQQALQSAIKEHYQNLFDEAKIKQAQLKQEIGTTLPIISTGHLTSVGASSSESVREIYVGSLEAFPTKDFPAADYIALGHIHQAQKVGGLEHIRYCGSPIALSFDEITQQKQVLLVELSEKGLTQVSALDVPTFQPMASVSGDFEQLASKIPELCEPLAEKQRLWLEVTICGDDYLNDLQLRLDAICNDLPCDILRLKRQRSSEKNTLEKVKNETLDELTTNDVFMRRLDNESLTETEQDQLLQLYKQVISKIQLEQNS